MKGLMRVSPCQFRLVILFLAMMALAFAALFPVNFTDLNKSLSSINSGEGIKTIGFFIVGIFYSMNKYSITSLLLFSALSLRERFQGLCHSVVYKVVIAVILLSFKSGPNV